MSNYEKRLRKLEPIPHVDAWLEEVNLRLMRYAIERRYVVFKNGKPSHPGTWDAGSAEFEAVYEKIKSHPRHAEMCAEVASGNLIYGKS